MESILIQGTNITDLTSVLSSTSDTPNYLYQDNIQKILSLPVYDEARIHTEGTLNIMALDIYKDEKLAWILSIYNGITDDDVVPGLVVRYPNLEAVREILKM